MSTTAKHALPYPDPDDPFSYADLEIKALAERLDDLLPKVGAAATNTNGSGQVVVNHGLPVAPTTVLVSNNGAGGTSHLCTVSAITSTQFTVTVRLVSTGATVNSTAVDLRWAAFLA